MSESVIERLVKTNPDMEVWWDSSPLIFDPWVARMVNAAPERRKAELEAQLRRLFNSADPAKSVIRGLHHQPAALPGGGQVRPQVLERAHR
jgi:transaldolase